jgi:hypothetical protein
VRTGRVRVRVAALIQLNSFKATKEMLVKSQAKALGAKYVIPDGLPNFENYLSIEKIEEVPFMLKLSTPNLT